MTDIEPELQNLTATRERKVVKEICKIFDGFPRQS